MNWKTAEEAYRIALSAVEHVEGNKESLTSLRSEQKNRAAIIAAALIKADAINNSNSKE